MYNEIFDSRNLNIHTSLNMEQSEKLHPLAVRWSLFFPFYWFIDTIFNMFCNTNLYFLGLIASFVVFIVFILGLFIMRVDDFYLNYSTQKNMADS